MLELKGQPISTLSKTSLILRARRKTWRWTTFLTPYRSAIRGHRQSPGDSALLPKTGTRTIAALGKKRWQIEPFSRIQKESLDVKGVLVTHTKVVKAHAGTVLISLILPVFTLLLRLGPDQSGGPVMRESFYSICQASLTNQCHATACIGKSSSLLAFKRS